MSYTSKFEQPSSYQPQSWPPRPHARFAHIPQGLVVLARITTWHEPPQDSTVTELESPAAAVTENLIAAEELPDSAAFFAQELNPPESVADETPAPRESETSLEANDIAAQLGHAPQYQAAIHDTVQRRAKALRAKRTLVTQWHLAGNRAVLNRLPSLHLWAMAGCWGQTRDEKLVIIDATNNGPELAQLLGWECAAGWSDLLLSRAALSETMHHTPWPNVTLIPRGSSLPEFDEDMCLRQASALGALQRDYRAVWILTAGAWDEAAQITSQHAGERQLIVPLNCPTSEWRELNAKLVAGNVLINGWVALNPAVSEQRRAA